MFLVILNFPYGTEVKLLEERPKSFAVCSIGPEK